MSKRLFLTSLFQIGFLCADLAYPDFTVSLLREGKDLRNYEANFVSKERHDDFANTKNLNIYRHLYARNILCTREASYLYRIPRIVHQIWLGSAVPPKYYDWMRTWMAWHGWDYKLWTDDDVKQLTLYNQELYDQAINYGEKSDILRLELLLQYGGIYADIDFECIRPEIFDELHRYFDFYIGFEPLSHGTIGGVYKICNALIGSAPSHPLVKQMILHLKESRIAHSHQTAVEQTGPDFFSRTILAYEREQLQKKHREYRFRNMYLPCTFFYPFSEPEVRAAESRESLLANIAPETAAVHYWSGSWHDGSGSYSPLTNDHPHSRFTSDHPFRNQAQ